MKIINCTGENDVNWLIAKPVNFSLGLLNCDFLFSCDSAWAVCWVGLQAVFDETKQEVTIKQPQREILRLAHSSEKHVHSWFHFAAVTLQCNYTTSLLSVYLVIDITTGVVTFAFIDFCP